MMKAEMKYDSVGSFVHTSYPFHCLLPCAFPMKLLMSVTAVLVESRGIQPDPEWELR